MKKFIADEGFWKIFPEALIGVLTVQNVQESIQLDQEKAAEIQNLLTKANEDARRFVPNETISENEVVRAWREAYSKFPTKKGARCSLEALLKRVLKGTPVGTIAPTVDISNAISLKHAFPIGAENMDAFQGDLHLGVMQGGEEFWPIGSDKMEPPLVGEIAYYDEAGVICRCWNWRDGKRTEVTEETTREFIAMECVEPERRGELQTALDELATLLSQYVGAEIITKIIVDKEHPEITIE